MGPARKKIPLFCILLLFLSCFCPLSLTARQNRIYFDLNLPLSLLGEGAATIFRQFEDLRAAVREKTGIDIKLQQPGSWEELINRLETGETDVAWLPPYFYARARTINKNSKIRPLVIYKSGDSIKSPVCIYSKSDTTRPKIEDLLAGRIAFPDEDTWVALNHIFYKDRNLSSLDIDPLHFFTAFRLLNRESSFEALQFDMVDAIVLELLYREYILEKDESAKKTVAVACTEPLPNTLIVYRNDLDPGTVVILKIILTNMHQNKDFKKFHRYFNTTSGKWAKAEDKDLKPWFDIYNESVRNGWDKSFRTLPISY